LRGLYTLGAPALLFERELKGMTKPTGSEWPRELIVKAARMLSYCERVQRQGIANDPFIFIAGALIAFEDMSPEEALKFLREKWDMLEEFAFTADMLGGVRRLDEELQPPDK
jgi:hypothetical protein